MIRGDPHIHVSSLNKRGYFHLENKRESSVWSRETKPLESPVEPDILLRGGGRAVRLSHSLNQSIHMTKVI